MRSGDLVTQRAGSGRSWRGSATTVFICPSGDGAPTGKSVGLASQQTLYGGARWRLGGGGTGRKGRGGAPAATACPKPQGKPRRHLGVEAERGAGAPKIKFFKCTVKVTTRQLV